MSKRCCCGCGSGWPTGARWQRWICPANRRRCVPCSWRRRTCGSLTNSYLRERRTMNDANTLLLKSNLKHLRLPTMHAEFEALAREAATANETYPQYLLRLTELEVAARAANVLKARIKQASFPASKDFDSYDFTAQPSLP